MGGVPRQRTKCCAHVSHPLETTKEPVSDASTHGSFYFQVQTQTITLCSDSADGGSSQGLRGRRVFKGKIHKLGITCLGVLRLGKRDIGQGDFLKLLV